MSWYDWLITIVPLCFVGIVLAQLLVEVAARYHYCLVPMMILMAAPVLQCGGAEQS